MESSWRKSSYSGDNGGECVEVASAAGSVLVRDTTWPGLEGCLRTTVGTRDENDRFLSALAEVLA